MSSFHQPKDNFASLSRYTSALAKPSRRASVLRPSTARPSTGNTVPSPTAPVFVVSRRRDPNPDHEPETPRTHRRQSFSNISNWVQTVEPGTPPPLTPLDHHSSRASRRQSTSATSPVKPTPSNHHTNMSHHYGTHAPEFLNAPPSSTCASESKSSRFGFMKRSKSTAPAPKKQPSQPSYSKNKPISRENLPPALMSELLLMQYTGGGSLETHLNRVLEAQAKQSAKSGGQPGAVGGIYRDEEGRIWWDEAEKVEYDSLLGERRGSAAESFIDFGSSDRRSRTKERRRPSAIQIPGASQPETLFDDSFVPQTAPIKESKKSSRSHVRGIFGMH